MSPRWPITAPATATLAGLRIDCTDRTPATLHNQLIGWNRIALSNGVGVASIAIPVAADA